LDSRRAIFYVKSPDFIIFMRRPSSSAGKINRHSIRRSMAYAARRSSKVNLSGVNGNVIINQAEVMTTLTMKERETAA
jgi:hypothetical protein